MFTEIRTELLRATRPAISLLILLTVVTGLIYPLAMTGLAQIVMPSQANGSLIVDGGRIVGSALIGQNFARPEYFHPRPSAAGKNGYDAGASAASNLAPGSRDLRNRIAETVSASGMSDKVPSDLVMASGSGLDPHISPDAALVQAARVAAARDIALSNVKALIAARTEAPLLGFIGEPRVNVLLLNRQLDRESAISRR